MPQPPDVRSRRERLWSARRATARRRRTAACIAACIGEGVEPTACLVRPVADNRADRLNDRRLAWSGAIDRPLAPPAVPRYVPRRRPDPPPTSQSIRPFSRHRSRRSWSSWVPVGD